MPYWPNCNSNANDFLERGGSLQDFFLFLHSIPLVKMALNVLTPACSVAGAFYRAQLHWGGCRLLCYSSQADWETWHSALSPEVELLAVLHCEEQSLLLQQLRNWSIAQLTHLMDLTQVKENISSW